MDFASAELEATHQRLAARFGAPVDLWWESLPRTIDDLASRWRLVVGDAVGRGNTSLVVRCRRTDGRPGILKLTPATRLVAAEAAALGAWRPSGRVPDVWHHDAALGALLLEAVGNGEPVSESGTEVTLGEIASLIADLHRAGAPDSQGIEHLIRRIEFIFDHWTRRHAARDRAIVDAVPVARLQRGGRLALKLAASAPPPVLLHGDLHPANVLDGGPGRGLIAIDPRPCLGDAATDAVDWVFWQAAPDAWEPRSRDLAAAIGVSHERLWTWCQAFAALLAASEAARGAPGERISALLEVAP